MLKVKRFVWLSSSGLAYCAVDQHVRMPLLCPQQTLGAQHAKSHKSRTWLDITGFACHRIGWWENVNRKALYLMVKTMVSCRFSPTNQSNEPGNVKFWDSEFLIPSHWPRLLRNLWISTSSPWTLMKPRSNLTTISPPQTTGLWISGSWVFGIRIRGWSLEGSVRGEWSVESGLVSGSSRQSLIARVKLLAITFVPSTPSLNM